jgi:hypothetical protein
VLDRLRARTTGGFPPALRAVLLQSARPRRRAGLNAGPGYERDTRDLANMLSISPARCLLLGRIRPAIRTILLVHFDGVYSIHLSKCGTVFSSIAWIDRALRAQGSWFEGLKGREHFQPFLTWGSPSGRAEETAPMRTGPSEPPKPAQWRF